MALSWNKFSGLHSFSWEFTLGFVVFAILYRHVRAYAFPRKARERKKISFGTKIRPARLFRFFCIFSTTHPLP